MFDLILVPLDGSAFAERAVPYAAAIARASGARLLLRRVLPLGAGDSGPGPEVVLEAVAARLRARGISVVYNVQPLFYGGLVAEPLSVAARVWDADLIVMATHAHGAPHRWLRGSVTEDVLRLADSPVLLVSPRCARAWPDDRVRCILTPLDGSAFAEATLGHVRVLAGSLRASLLLLQVTQSAGRGGDADSNPGSDVRTADPNDVRDYLERTAAALRGDGHSVATLTATGPAARAIVRTARERGADLIAMATHGRSGLVRRLLGGVADGVLRQANVPVLLTRPRAERKDR